MKSALLFPGYGSQFVGMGKELYDTERIVQEYFEEAATCLSVNFVKLCFASSEIELAKPCHAYTSLFLMGASSAALIKEHAFVPEVVAGVDISSWYSSLFAAGSISFPDGLYILNKLGTLYEDLLVQKNLSGILIKNSTKKKIERWCTQASTVDEYVSIAQILPQGCIVAGHTQAIERLQKAVAEIPGVTYEAADINGGLYMSAVEDVVLNVNSYLEKIDFKEPQLKVLSPINGKFVKRASDIKQVSSILFAQQLDQLAVLHKISEYAPVSLAIPSQRIRMQLSAIAPEIAIEKIDTTVEFEALKIRYHIKEEPSHGE